ncbi:unnamed protein product [Auanema sp. JU1783]|nr:unnamed protein product [Auanema sp. JU1783]
MVCILMPFFGMPAYEASVNYTEPEDMTKYIPKSPELSREYSDLYSSCPEVNSTISSCSLQIDECSYGPIYCAEQLCNCLVDAHQIDNSTSCQSTTARICTIAIRDAELAVSRKRIEELGITVLLMIGSVCCLTIALYWFYMKMKEKAYSREVKYVPVA